MSTQAVSLCAYCEATPSRAGDLYCCDGCKTLSKLSGRPPVLKPSADDPVLIRDFGRTEGHSIRFECHVDSLACEACLQGLSRLEQVVPGLEDLQWHRRSSVLSFRFSRDHATPARVFDLLKDLRLTPRWRDARLPSPSVETGRKGALRIGLTGALVGNIMLFAVPIYGGLDGTLRTVFEWIQFALFLPIFLFSARPFYRTAWMSLRWRQLSVDLPLTIAFVVGSVFSTVGLLRGNHDVYFDSLAGFLFLILWSRSLLESSLAKTFEQPQLEMFFESAIYQVLRDGQERSVALRDLRVGDELRLSQGQRVPADGRLLSNWAEFETAWMTGEKTPCWRLKDSLIQAGTRVLNNACVMRIETPPRETDFARLLNRLSDGEKLNAPLEARIGGALVLTSFLLIAGLFLFGASLGVEEVLHRALGLLIVACPCAVSFAAPLARAKANRIAFRRGFWVQDPLVWPRLTNVKRIAFDKTGTLTGGAFALAPHGPMIDPHWKRVILSLENVSRHPIAESLRRAWGPMLLLEVEGAEEIPGRGVRGSIKGITFELSGSPSEDGVLRLELWKSGERVVELRLQDEAAIDAESAIHNLQKDHELYIISGDRPSRVEEFGRRYGFRSDHLFGGLSPDQKADVITRLSPDLYFGDGTNDLPAMKRTPVSVAVRAAALEAQAASDIVMFEASLGDVDVLFNLAEETRKLNRRNLTISLVYNACAGLAALLGWIHPLAAAVLMPIASLSLLFSTLRGTALLRRMEAKR